MLACPNCGTRFAATGRECPNCSLRFIDLNNDIVDEDYVISQIVRNTQIMFDDMPPNSFRQLAGMVSPSATDDGVPFTLAQRDRTWQALRDRDILTAKIDFRCDSKVSYSLVFAKTERGIERGIEMGRKLARRVRGVLTVGR